MFQSQVIKFRRVQQMLDARLLAPFRAFMLEQRVRREMRSGEIVSHSLEETLAIFQIAKSLELSRQLILASEILRQIVPKLKEHDATGSYWRDARRVLAENCYKQELYQEAEAIFRELVLEDCSDALLPKRMYLYRLISLAEMRNDLVDQINCQKALVDLCQKNLSKTSLCRRSAEADLAKSEKLANNLSQEKRNE